MNPINMRLYRSFSTLTLSTMQCLIPNKNLNYKLVSRRRTKLFSKSFSVFKSHLEDRIDQKGKEIELRSKLQYMVNMADTVIGNEGHNEIFNQEEVSTILIKYMNFLKKILTRKSIS